MKNRQVGFSPKVITPTLILALAGVVLAVLDALGVIDVEDELWIALLGAGGVTFGAGYAASPGVVVERRAVHPRAGERGLTSVKVLAILTLAGVAALLLITLT
jgi:hypothetical protein